MPLNSRTSSSLFTLFSYLAIFSYVLIRAYVLSFTHDESLSYTIMEGDPEYALSANNHLLNTFLMKVFSGAFGKGELALRLPNVLAFGLYLFAAFSLLKEAKNMWMFFFGNILLILNPFFLDFFSLSRGYGLSMGFVMISLFFTLRGGFQEYSGKSFVWDFALALLFASLACFSNLSTINYLITILLIFTIKYFFLVRKSNTSNGKLHLGYALVMLLSFIPLFFAIKRLLLLDERNQLYHGTYSLLDSIDSLVYSSLYFTELPYGPIIKYVILAFLMIGILSLLFRKDFHGKFAVISLINITLIIGLVLEHHLFEAKYPAGRTAIIFVPVFGLFVYYMMIHFFTYYKLKKIYSSILLFIIAAPLFIHFVSSINFMYTYSWKYDAHTKDVMMYIENYSEPEMDELSISNNWLFTPSINYYISSRNLNVKPTNKKGVNLSTDFIYEFEKELSSENLTTLLYFEDIGSSLVTKAD